MNRRLLELNKPSLLCLLLVVGVSAPLTSVQSAMILNPGFDLNTGDPVVPLNWTTYDPPDLDLTGVYTGIDEHPYVGAVNPSDYYNSARPDNAAYVYAPNGVTGPFGSGSTTEYNRLGLEQRLTDTLQVGTYELSVEVGNPQSANGFDLSGFGGYGLELLAGPCLEPTDENEATRGVCIVDGATSLDSDAIAIVDGEFATVSFSVDVLDSHALLGLALGVRVYNLNLDVPTGADTQVDFDNVALTFSPVPVPAAIWLFGTALLGLAGFNRRRKRAA